MKDAAFKSVIACRIHITSKTIFLLTDNQKTYRIFIIIVALMYVDMTDKERSNERG